MPLNWFFGRPDTPPSKQPVEIRSVNRELLFGPAPYDAERGLVDAVNTALLLDQPLLLTGEPGTGKTQLAEKLALELGMEPLFKFETKSISAAQDLFYTFDHVARFQAGQGQADVQALHPLNFIDYNALGRAVLQSLPPEQAREWFAPEAQLPLWYRGPRRAVVMIDEIDKAPTDFPNDLLNEIERHYFRIREYGSREVRATSSLRPIVVITSNSEKQLPDAFLRRCIFYHLQPIERKRLQEIALRRLAVAGLKSNPGKLLEDALQLFFDLRSPAYDLRKKPSTAEFLAFMTGLVSETTADMGRPLQAGDARGLLSTLVKAPEDQSAASRHPMLAEA